MSGGIFGHDWMRGIFGDDEAGGFFAPDAELAAMIRVERAFAMALGKAGIVAPKIAAGAADAIAAARIDRAALASAVERDGLPVPDLVRQLLAQAAPELHAAIHKGMTSQDVIDTGLVLRLVGLCELYDARLAALTLALSDLTARHGAKPLMGRTRMQAALWITVADRVETWRLPLEAHRARLVQLRPVLLRLQLGGPVGERAALGAKGAAVAAVMAAELGLGDPARAWHAMREGIVDFAGWLSLVTGSLGKIGQDMALMAQQGVDEIELAGGGSSSAMPHKQNPVLADLLVTLARFNATQVAGMHHALVHEQERSGTAWPLEWMILPPMALATGRALTATGALLGAIRRIGAPG